MSCRWSRIHHRGSAPLQVALAGRRPRRSRALDAARLEAQLGQFQIPAGVGYGTQVFAQSLALIAPFSQPGGQNAFGATMSNGLASFISGF